MSISSRKALESRAWSSGLCSLCVCMGYTIDGTEDVLRTCVDVGLSLSLMESIHS